MWAFSLCHFLVLNHSQGYLYDRRQSRFTMASRWGGSPRSGQELTTCIRKFGRPPQSTARHYRREHITGARLSRSNGHEVWRILHLPYHQDSQSLLSGHLVWVLEVSFPANCLHEIAYSGDGVYLFSTMDDPTVTEDMSRCSPTTSTQVCYKVHFFKKKFKSQSIVRTSTSMKTRL